jgi:hypothetical protein
MPLLIYGAEVTNEETEISIDNFADLVDNHSWEEFMPKGVTKQTFRKFSRMCFVLPANASGRWPVPPTTLVWKSVLSESLLSLAPLETPTKRPY